MKKLLCLLLCSSFMHAAVKQDYARIEKDNGMVYVTLYQELDGAQAHPLLPGIDQSGNFWEKARAWMCRNWKNIVYGSISLCGAGIAYKYGKNKDITIIETPWTSSTICR